MEYLERVLTTRWTDSEREELRVYANRAGLNISAAIRRLALSALRQSGGIEALRVQNDERLAALRRK